MNYNELNFHARDPHLHFDPESHTYTLGEQTLTSVTNIVENCFPKFDADYWAARKAPQLGLTPEALKERWADNARRARSLGTAMHERIERYYLGEDFGEDGDAYSMFRHFAAAETLYPFRSEWRIYMEDYSVAGTLDFLERRPDGTFSIYDWKRSKKLIDTDGRVITTNRTGARGFYPVSHLADCSYNHYALQLSIYRFILEQRYGIPISRMLLGVFHPESPRAYVIPVPYMRLEAEAILRAHVSRLTAKTETINHQTIYN